MRFLRVSIYITLYLGHYREINFQVYESLIRYAV